MLEKTSAKFFFELILSRILVVLFFMLFAEKVWGTNPEFLRRIGLFKVTEEVTAISINADESMVAVAMEDDGDALVELRELASGKILHQLISPHNPVEEMVFDFRTNLLAVSGNKRIELWDLETPQKGGSEIIPLSFRIWNADSEHKASPDFSIKSSKLRWINGNALKEIPLKAPFISSMVWTGEGKGRVLKGFSFDPDEKMLALTEQASSEIRILQPLKKRLFPSLDYHYFQVVGMFFLDSNNLISLDKEHNLAWGRIQARTKTSPPKSLNDFDNGQALRLYRLYKDQVLLYTTSNPSLVLVVDRRGMIYHTFPLASGSAVAVSPTGRYVLTGAPQNEIKIYQSVLHQSPESYLDQLRHSGAKETARRFKNQLSETLPESRNSSLNLSQNSLKILEENLNVSEKTQDWSEADRIAHEILILDPKNSKALKALEMLSGQKHQVMLVKGQKLLDQQEYAQAVNLLKLIPSSSSLYRQAKNLIALADRSVQVSLTLMNVKEQMRIGNWEGAAILLKKILEEDPLNSQATELLEEAESSKFWTEIQRIFYYLLIFCAALVIFWWIYKKRENFIEGFQSKKEEPVILKTFSNINQKTTPRNQISSDEKKFRETLKKTQEFMDLAKQRDISGEHSGRLMDFEAEIKIINEKGGEVVPDFKLLNTQLTVIMQTLRGLNFKQSSRKSQKTKSYKAEEKTPSQKPSYYELLGVNSNATEDEIKKAFHSKIKEYHPDRHQNTEFDWVRKKAASMSRELTEAYDILIDQESRKHYDTTLK